MSRQSVFTVGGTVQAGRGRYVPRSVDGELLALCRERKFAFVLSARQMGKSSLMVHTAARLAEEGVRTLIIDLSQVGIQVTQDSWYLSVLTSAEDRLRLKTDVYDWWQDHVHLSYAERLTRFFREVLLREITDPIVIFVDEIDSTLSLPFTDDFFAAIRYIYNARSSFPEFERLSFVLIGVATPNDLMSDPRRTPFNIGQGVDVDYFSMDEAMVMADGFDFPQEHARRVLKWILRWTAGHPYLTQRLCAVVAENRGREPDEADIDNAVASTFLNEKAEQDANLRFVNDMLTRWAPDRIPVLETYRLLLRGRSVRDDKQSMTITHLKLAGVARPSEGQLRLSVPLYASVFDRAWLKRQWPEHWIKRIPPMALGLVAAVFVTTILLALFVIQSQRAQQAVERSRIQEELNSQLRAQIELSDSLRLVAEVANERLSQSNVQLSEQVQISDSLRFGTEAINTRLSSAIAVSDSLRTSTEIANARLSNQVVISDSLRRTAESTLTEAQAARLETITIALANQAQRQLRLGDPALGALLARQAFLFNEEGTGEFLDPVYGALVQSLDELAALGLGTGGGPDVLDNFVGEVRSIAYRPDGRQIAAGVEDGSIALIDTRSNSIEWLPGHSGRVRTLAFSPNEAILVSGGDDNALIVWSDLDNHPVGLKLDGHPGQRVWATAFNDDGSFLATADADRMVKVWSMSNPQSVPIASISVPDHVKSMAFGADEGMLFTAGDEGSVHVLDWREPDRPSVVWQSGQERIYATAFQASSGLLATGGATPPIKLWSITRNDTAVVHVATLYGHQGPVNTLSFSRDGSLLASGSGDGSVQIWQTRHPDRNPILLQSHLDWVWALEFSPDGNRLASAGADRTVRIWNIDAGSLAESVCHAVGDRDLTSDEWSRFVGNDFSYKDVYQSCAAHAQIHPSKSGPP